MAARGRRRYARAARRQDTAKDLAQRRAKEGVMLAREPFPKKIDSWFDRIDPFFGADLMPRLTWPRRLESATEWRPNVDIVETKDEFLVKCDVPEVKKEDVKIDVVDGMLRIRGERRFDVDEKKDTVHRVETFYGTFMRSFALPETVDVRRITADVAHGVLKVHLPKLPSIAAKPIEIAVQ
jgi:HSP20 family protein